MFVYFIIVTGNENDRNHKDIPALDYLLLTQSQDVVCWWGLFLLEANNKQVET